MGGSMIKIPYLHRPKSLFSWLILPFVGESPWSPATPSQLACSNTMARSAAKQLSSELVSLECRSFCVRS